MTASTPHLDYGIVTAITRDDVAHLARLARLDLTDEERDHYAEQLDAIVEAVARISEVATDDVTPMSHPLPLTNVFRADVVQSSLDRTVVLAAAPEAEDERFKVPRILDHE
jgi:aspartyl-tRNA(Asn)/glutamyl-tRNA(Gln) amidotransferase subunit C